MLTELYGAYSSEIEAALAVERGQAIHLSNAGHMQGAKRSILAIYAAFLQALSIRESSGRQPTVQTV